MSEAAKTEYNGESVRKTIMGALYVVGATVLWSAVPICAKFALRAVDAYTICWIRFAVGSLILLTLRRGHIIRRTVSVNEWALLALGAVGIGGNYVMYIRGIQSTTASAGNIVVQFEVISLVILSYFVLKERMTPSKILGMFVTFLGVMIALWNGESLRSLLASENFFGNLLILVAAPLWAVYGIAQKILADRGFGISSSLAYIFSIAAVLTFPAAAMGFDVHGKFTASVIIALIVVSVFGTAAAYVMIGKGFELLNASTAGMITCLLPIFTILNARVFLNEQLTPCSHWEPCS
ncbi:MAG: DMT family transporter [Armatimonadota bacterium]|nr:DMT family transporter [Armatimonadota bacterium]